MAWPLLLWGALSLLPAAARPSPVACNGSAARTVVTLAAVLPERDVRYLWAWPRVGPALSLALEALEPQLGPAGLCVRLEFASADGAGGSCSYEEAERKATELRVSHAPDVLLGVGCDSPTFDAGRWAAQWRLPLLTAGHYYREPEFKTTVYAGPTGRELNSFLALLHRRFHWTARAAFAFSQDAHDFHRYASLLRLDRSLLGAPNFTNPRSLYSDPEEAVQFIQANGRVVYIYGPLKTLQEILHLAQVQNMTSGDYVFFYLDPFGKSLQAEEHREAAKPWQSKENQDVEGLRQAFQTVLIITCHEPQTTKYQHFQSQRILRAQRDFGVVLNDSLREDLVAGCFHDGLLLYVQALLETVREGGTKQNTKRILEKMRELKIQGVTGTVSIDSRNDREMDFDLWTMADTESGEYQVVGHYVGSEKRIKWTGPIHWKKGGPPLDNPPCVFDMNVSSCGSTLAFGLEASIISYLLEIALKSHVLPRDPDKLKVHESKENIGKDAKMRPCISENSWIFSSIEVFHAGHSAFVSTLAWLPPVTSSSDSLAFRSGFLVPRPALR